jgi:Kef-type K+ transport system membrane component KefB
METIVRLFIGIEARKLTTWVKPILLAACLGWVPAQVVEILVIAVAPGPAAPDLFLRPFQAISMAIVIAPVIETYLMRWLFRLLGRFIQHRERMNWTAAMLWGVMHWNTPAWGLPAIWPFYVMGVCFLTIRDKDPQAALYVTMLVHALFNALSYGAYLIVGPSYF